MKILLYTTNPEWKSWDQKLSACRGALGCVKGIKEVQIDMQVLNGHPRAVAGKVDRAWYNTLTIDARKKGYQMVAVHMNTRYARDLEITKYRGCAINDEAMGEVWIVADEEQKVVYDSGRMVNRFVKVFVHEMSHWMADYLGQLDLTHHYDYERERVLLALTPYHFKEGYMERIVSALRREVIRAPLDNWKSLRVSQHYGVASPEYKSGIHAGTDFAVPVGRKIYAPTDGRITVVWRDDKTLGNAFVFEFFHNGKMYSLRCAHLKSTPKKGGYRRGEVIGLTGNTGKSTGPHCHMEVWRGGYDYDVLLSKDTVLSNLVNPYVLFNNITTHFV